MKCASQTQSFSGRRCAPKWAPPTARLCFDRKVEESRFPGAAPGHLSQPPQPLPQPPTPPPSPPACLPLRTPPLAPWAPPHPRPLPLLWFSSAGREARRETQPPRAINSTLGPLTQRCPCSSSCDPVGPGPSPTAPHASSNLLAAPPRTAPPCRKRSQHLQARVPSRSPVQSHGQPWPCDRIASLGGLGGGGHRGSCTNGCFPLFSNTNLAVLPRRRGSVLMQLVNCVQTQRKRRVLKYQHLPHVLAPPWWFSLLQTIVGFPRGLGNAGENSVGWIPCVKSTDFLFFPSFALNINLEYITLHSPYEKHFKRNGWNYLLKLIPHIKLNWVHSFRQ